MQPDPNNLDQTVSGVPAAPAPNPQSFVPAPVAQPLVQPTLQPDVQPTVQPVADPLASNPIQQEVVAPPPVTSQDMAQAPEPVFAPGPVFAPEQVVTPGPIPEPLLAPTVATPTVPTATAVEQPVSFQAPSVAAPVEPAVVTPTVQLVASQPVFDVIAPQVISSEPAMAASPVQMPVSASGSSSKGKIFKIIGGVVGAIVLLAGIALVALGLTANKQIVYKSSDLTKVTTKTYSVSYAKQWTDLSANKSVLSYLKNSLGNDTSLVDQKIYGYKYNPKTDQGQTLLLVADTPLGVSDDELKRGLADPTAKQQFESSFKGLTGSLDGDNLCQSVTGKHETSKYDTAKYLVEVKADVDCNYTQANQTKYGTKGIHQVIFLGIKNGNTYLATLVASQSDWAKNSTFYNDNVLSSLSPL